MRGSPPFCLKAHIPVGQREARCALQVPQYAIGLSQQAWCDVPTHTTIRVPGAALLGFGDDPLCATYTSVESLDRDWINQRS